MGKCREERKNKDIEDRTKILITYIPSLTDVHKFIDKYSREHAHTHTQAHIHNAKTYSLVVKTTIATDFNNQRRDMTIKVRQLALTVTGKQSPVDKILQYFLHSFLSSRNEIHV